MKKCAVVQSSYIPWKGYFDLINTVNDFVLFDDVQYTKRDWRSRNQIKTAQGTQWLTIPVQVKGKFQQLIKEVVVSDRKWVDKHWRSLEFNYRRSPFFLEIGEKLFKVYEEAKYLDKLSEINYLFIKNICQWLHISTDLSWSMDYCTDATNKNQRLIDICLAVKASIYLSGPAAQIYLDHSEFESQGLSIEYMNYEGYHPYIQRFEGFLPNVSIVDLLFNVGIKAAPLYMKSFSTQISALSRTKILTL